LNYNSDGSTTINKNTDRLAPLKTQKSNKKKDREGSASIHASTFIQSDQFGPPPQGTIKEKVFKKKKTKNQ